LRLQSEHDPVPAALKLKALERLDMYERAVEERQRVTDDIWATVTHFCDLHTSVSSAVESQMDASGRARILRQLVLLEQFLQDLWRIIGKYLPDIPVLPSYPGLSKTAKPINCDDLLDIDLDSDASDTDDDELDAD